MKNKIKNIIILQFSVIIYSLSGVFGKLASKYDFFSDKYIAFLFLELLLLGLYALAWQQIIKKMDISLAYANKATSIIWSLIIAIVIFKEDINLYNIIGIVFIFIGVLMVNKYD